MPGSSVPARQVLASSVRSQPSARKPGWRRGERSRHATRGSVLATAPMRRPVPQHRHGTFLGRPGSPWSRDSRVGRLWTGQIRGARRSDACERGGKRRLMAAGARGAPAATPRRRAPSSRSAPRVGLRRPDQCPTKEPCGIAWRPDAQSWASVEDQAPRRDRSGPGSTGTPPSSQTANWPTARLISRAARAAPARARFWVPPGADGGQSSDPRGASADAGRPRPRARASATGTGCCATRCTNARSPPSWPRMTLGSSTLQIEWSSFATARSSVNRPTSRQSRLQF